MPCIDIARQGLVAALIGVPGVDNRQMSPAKVGCERGSMQKASWSPGRDNASFTLHRCVTANGPPSTWTTQRNEKADVEACVNDWIGVRQPAGGLLVG